jgi:hypothetical protein
MQAIKPRTSRNKKKKTSRERERERKGEINKVKKKRCKQIK